MAEENVTRKLTAILYADVAGGPAQGGVAGEVEVNRTLTAVLH